MWSVCTPQLHPINVRMKPTAVSEDFLLWFPDNYFIFLPPNMSIYQWQEFKQSYAFTLQLNIVIYVFMLIGPTSLVDKMFPYWTLGITAQCHTGSQ